jgi:hypothetical protein
MTKRPLQYLPLLAVMCGLNVGASCLSTGDDDYSSRSSEDSASLPRDAVSVQSGRGDISYRVTEDGRVFVYDSTDNRLRWDKNVDRGDVVLVRPDADRIGLNDRLEKVELERENSHRIYFQSASRKSRRDRDSRDDRYDDRDDRGYRSANGVPDHARMMADGRGEAISFKAPEDGRVYVYDNSNSKLVQSYPIERGQRFTVDPDGDVVAIERREVDRNIGLSRRSEYRLLFAD